MSADTLSDVEDSSDEAPRYRDEAAAYIDYKTPADGTLGVLPGWGKRVHFPILLSLPGLSGPSLLRASSTANKRDFSSAGSDIQERRSQLKPSTVDDVLFLHSNHAPRQTPDSVIPWRSMCLRFLQFGSGVSINL